MGGGGKVSFWHDHWGDHKPLAYLFPRVCLNSNQKEVRICRMELWKSEIGELPSGRVP